MNRYLPPHADQIREFARHPTILVACDYDGTLSPIVENPSEAFPERESVVALRGLAELPDTHVAVVSGRSLRDLATLSRLPHEIHLVGSHGSEFDAGFVHSLTSEQLKARNEITSALRDIAERHPGSTVEQKPASVAFHYRNVDPEGAEVARREVLEGPATLPGVHVKTGKMVTELAVLHTHKGEALEQLRRQVGADAVLFIGDDVTDEDGFDTLRGPDLGVKVGPGSTLAQTQVDNTSDVARLLGLLFEIRRAWLEGDSTPAIERHSMLSDQRTVALVTPDARVTWMCHPRADGPAVFAELLGGPRVGFFSVHPEHGNAPISQRYVGDTMILETKWAGLTVTDYLDVSFGREQEPAGRTDLLRVLEGSGRAVIEFAPRLDYGRAITNLTVGDDGVIVQGQQRIRLHAPAVEWELIEDGQHHTATGTVDLDSGPVVLELRFDEGEPDPVVVIEPRRREGTARYWQEWADPLRLPTRDPKMAKRSALAIKALCYQPSGAILAAATTSIPEALGGVRNWDYRYCWPRDSTMSAAALLSMGSTSEAVAILDWVLDRVEHLPSPEHLRPLYAVEGDGFLPEAVLPTLNGYRGSRPVRIGNAADTQVQLDVFGPIVNLVWKLSLAGVEIQDRHWLLVTEMVEAVEARWFEPDHGIWEERRPPRHHVHSKVMCWQAIDRAVRLGRHTGREVPDSWAPLADRISIDVLTQGWNPDVGAYTIAYGDDELDASVLHLGLSGLLPPDDERFMATVKAIERDLRHGPIVYRYRLDDGLPGEEGGFLLCTAWLVEAYMLMGRRSDAEALFASYKDFAGPTGLLPEQWEPRSETGLGNLPQAYSHLGLIDAAFSLD